MRHEYLCIGGRADGQTVMLDLSVMIRGLVSIAAVDSVDDYRLCSPKEAGGRHDYYRVGKLEIDDCIFRVMILGSMSTADAITQLIKGYKV